MLQQEQSWKSRRRTLGFGRGSTSGGRYETGGHGRLAQPDEKGTRAAHRISSTPEGNACGANGN
ncbi:MAG: hypothetical protein WCD37_09420 [Chloroflexia bacterium]